MTAARLDAGYVLPIRRDVPADRELAEYLRWLGDRIETVVVDGSPPAVFAAHAAQWPNTIRHERVDEARRCANGKVAGVLTGLDRVQADRVVIADDDVRYDDVSLRTVVALLAEHDLVRPQNYFDPLPWHAAWDSGRTLLNRAVAADFPGTLGVRKAVLERTGGYDGDVLFENLELIRTIEAAGGRTTAPLDLYVRRLPPTAEHFWGQRVRQAYDEIARPYRMALELSVAPLAIAAARQRRWGRIAVGVAAVIGTAEVGRRRAGGTAVFPGRASAAAPLWVAERAVCSWLALGNRVLRGGVPYAGGVVRRPATPPSELRRRLAEPAPADASVSA